MSMMVRSMGTRPEDLPPVERMYESEARTWDMEMPTPPAAREISAHWRRESKIPSMLSSLHVSKKHEASCCRGQPALNIVGVACVKRPRDISSYAWYMQGKVHAR